MLFPFFCLESMISISTETQYIVEPNVNIKIVVTIKLYRNVSSVELFFGDETASKIYENELYIDNSTDTTAVFDKLYSSQGNYTLKASVMYAGVEYQKVTDIYVWEQLYVILTVPNKVFSTEETVSFVTFHVKILTTPLILAMVNLSLITKAHTKMILTVIRTFLRCITFQEHIK